MSRLNKNIVLMLAAIIISLFMLEIAARLIAYKFPDFECETFADPSDALLCKLHPKLLEIVSNQATTNKKDICDKWDSQLGWMPKPNCRTSLYSTNSRGFRGTQEYSLKKSRNRIIALGDSFTWGENNLDNETYPFYLHELYNGTVDVVNMGVHGYGPDQFYLYYMRDGMNYNADAVVIGLFLPDIHRTIFRVRDYFKPRFMIEGNSLKLEASYIPNFEKALEMSSEIKKKKRSYAFSYLYGLFTKAQRRFDSYRNEVKLTLKIIDELNRQLEKQNAKLVVLLIPEQEMAEKGNDDYYGAVLQITQYLEKENIDYINLQPAFKANYKKGNNLYIGHLKPEGNLLIANELYSFLNEHKLLPQGESK